jgi:carbon starvation protein
LAFLSHPHLIQGQMAANALPAAIKTIADAQRVIFNDYLDAGVAAFFMISVVVILADSVREWVAVLGGHKPTVSSEVPFDASVAVVGD